ncbi:MAG TPA: hypothetical protein VF765_04645 [Polyangiaceae bacterium]
MRWFVALAAFALVMSAAGASRATPTSRLVYSRSVDAGSCPDEQALRHEVAARVGYDPFFPWATRTIVAGITRREGAFVATVDLVDDQGLSHGARELRTDRGCDDLLGAMALAIAIAIDPQSLSRVGPPPPPPPSPPPASEPSVTTSSPVAAPEQPAPQASRASPWGVDASVGLVGSGGLAPSFAAGLALGAGVRWRMLSFSLEGLIDAPSISQAQGGGTVTTWLVLADVAPCVHFGSFLACALGQVGSMQASGNGVSDARSTSVPWWAAGGRLGAMVRLSDATSLRFRTDVVANLDRATLVLNGTNAWQYPAVGASLGFDLVLHFR